MDDSKNDDALKDGEKEARKDGEVEKNGREPVKNSTTEVRVRRCGGGGGFSPRDQVWT